MTVPRSHGRGAARVPVETVVLCYHNIVPDGTPPELCEALLAVPVSAFERQIRYLSRRFDCLTFDEVEGGRWARRAVVLTFDDGYRAVVDHALPVLGLMGLPAYVFVNPAFVGGWNSRDKLMGLALYGSNKALEEVGAFLGVRMVQGDLLSRSRHFVSLRTEMWAVVAERGETGLDEIEAMFERHREDRVLRGLQHSRLLSWNDLRLLRARGVRVGNHTQRHLELDSLPRDAVRREIRDARQDLRQHLGADEPAISYPRGKWNQVVCEEARAAGYRWGLVTTPGAVLNGRPTLATPRVVVSPQVSLPGLLWKMSRLRRWARRSLRRT